MKIKENIEFGTTIALWGQCSDRFLSQGYKSATTFEEKIELISSIKDIKGVDLYGDWDVNTENVDEISASLKKYDLKTYLIASDINSLPEFGRGSICSPYQESRELAWKKIKESIDIARKLSAPMVDICFMQDGFDYSFQIDYVWAWETIINTIRIAAEYAAPDIKIGLEYKAREPRTNIFTANASKMLLISERIKKDNVGIIIDAGHGYIAGENVSETLALCKIAGDKLYYIHFNDNHKKWDDDMMVGSVHPFELLEFLYWLEKTNYNGPYVLDMFPYREDPFGAARESIEFIKDMRNVLKKLDEKDIKSILDRQDAVAAMKLMRELFVK